MHEFQSVKISVSGGAAATSWLSLGDHVDGAARDLCDDKGKTLTAKGEAERSAPYAPHIHAQCVAYLLSSLPVSSPAPPQSSAQPPDRRLSPFVLVIDLGGRFVY